MRRPTIINNIKVKQFLLSAEGSPRWIDGVLEQASKKYTAGTSPMNKGKILSLLCSLDTLSIVTVSKLLNKSHQKVYGRPMSDRMVKYWFAVLKEASLLISNKSPLIRTTGDSQNDE